MTRKARDYQIGGDHYKTLVYQPVDLTVSYDLGGLEHSIVKYVTRWPSKGGLQDLRKGLHIAEMLVENAAKLIVARSRKRDFIPALSAKVYCAANGLPANESDIIAMVCAWSIDLVEGRPAQIRNALLALIHQAKQEGWE